MIASPSATDFRPPLVPRVKSRVLALALAVGVVACGPQSSQSLVASGKQLGAEGNSKAALIQYRAALQKDPQDTEARILLGQTLLADGDAAAAAIELTKALDAKGAPATVLPMLTRALLLSGDYKKLVVTYGDMGVDDKAALAAVKVNLATAWGALSDPNKSQAAIAAALAAVPDYPPARLLQARLLAAAGKIDEAKALVEKALAADDKLADAWQLRGELLAASGGNAKTVEEYFRKALEVDKRHISAHGAIIGARLWTKDIAGAKAQADELRKAFPGHPLSLLVDAQIAYTEGDLPRAREMAQRLVRYLPDNQSVLVLAGNIEADLGSMVQAQAYFGKVLQLNPTVVMARRNLARVEIQLGQYGKALETLKPLLQATPPRIDALALAGDAELRQNNLEAAERYFAKAASQEPSNERLRIATAVARIGRGDPSAGFDELEGLSSKTSETYADRAIYVARMKRGEYQAAQQALDRIVAKEPKNAANLELRGRLELARNNLPAARAAFEQAAKADPKLFSAVTSLAAIDQLEGQPDKAIARMQAAVAENPKNTPAWMALAELKSKADAPIEEIKKLLGEAIASAPASSAPRLQLIELLLRKRQNKDAMAAARDALAAMPGDATVLEAVGRAQFKAGDVEQALTTFRKLVALAPKSAIPYLRLANVFSAMGDRKQAESALNLALEIEPGDSSVQAALLDLLVSSNRQSEALDNIRRFKQSKPRQPVPYLLEATYYLRQKNIDAAAAAYREGIEKTGSSELAVGLYNLLMQSGRNADAEQWAAGWIKKHPQDIAMEYQLAITSISRNDLNAGEDRLKRVLAVQPNNPLALNNLAWVLATRGKPGGVAYARRALDLMPDDPATLDTLALALAAESHLPEALAVQKRAVGLAPSDGGLRLGLAKLALQAGDKATAKAELKGLQDMGARFPAQAEVSRLLQGL